MKFFVYSKNGIDEEKQLKDLLYSLASEYEIEIVVCRDSKRGNNTYREIKTEFDKETVLVISNINVLGSDSLDIYKELLYLQNMNSYVVILDLKSSHTLDIEKNHTVLNTVIEMYEINNSKIINGFKAHQASLAGRKKIKYPENWDELYRQWENKNISSKEFMEKSGLKKGTFYHLITEYKELQTTKNKMGNLA